jgi:hypothetical protein
MNTVAAAAIMKVAVATIERGENRASPQTACPLVQPDPIIDPNPTMKPAIAMTGRFVAMLMPLQSFRPSAVTSSAPSGNPAMNARRHDLPPASLGAITFTTIPQMPAIRPIVSIRRTAAEPMRAPPISPDIGANSVT